MRAIWLLGRLRLKEMVHSPGSAGVYLGMPLMLLVVLAVVFMHGHPFERRTVTVVAPPVPAAIAEVLARFPEVRPAEDRSLDVALGKLRTRTVNAVLVADPSVGGTPRLIVGPRDELFGRGLVAALPVRATLTVAPTPRWGYVHYLFPGLLVITVIAGGLLGMGYSMVRYRSNQFLKKLATTPLTRGAFVASQIGSRVALVLGQLALMTVAAWLLFDLPLTPASAAWLAGLSTLGLLTFMGLGFTLACFIRNEANLLDLINVLIMPIVFLSEVFFSLDELPLPLARFAALLPSTQLVRMVRMVVLYGETAPGPLWAGVGWLVAWMALSFAVAVRSFRWYDR
jgi:ABC-2 type transport system permease protein